MKKSILALTVLFFLSPAWGETLYFVDAQGNYLGGYDGTLPPHGAIKIPGPPRDGKDKYIDGSWLPYVEPVSLSDQLTTLFGSLPAEIQADLSPLAAAAKLHLDAGKPEIAKLIIQRAQIPAELEPLRAQMLELFE